MVYRDSVTRTTGSTPAWSFGSGTTPSSANQGDVYVVSAGFELTSATAFIVSGKTIPAGKYEAGDMIVYNGLSWNVINGENQVEVTAGGAELTVPATNTLGSAVTIATVDGTAVQVKLKHDTSGVTPDSYGETAVDESTLSYGGFVHIPYITVNNTGHITAASTKTLKLPAERDTFSSVKSGAASTAVTKVTSDTNTINSSAAGDTLTIAGGNKWIVTATDTTNRKLIIGHGGPGDNGDMIAAKTQTTSGTGENSSAAQTAVMGQAFKIPYLAYDAAGHITSSGTKDVTLPSWNTADNYAFKTITPANSSSTTTDLTGNTTSLEAESNTDTLNIKGYNKWIVLSGTASRDTLNIAHKSGYTAKASGLYKIAIDEAGHVTGTTDVAAADITNLIGSHPTVNDGKLKISAASTSSATTLTDTEIFSANTSSTTTISLSNDGTTGKFRFASNTIYLDVIDGGLV
jgi:hypothetical protein